MGFRKCRKSKTTCLEFGRERKSKTNGSQYRTIQKSKTTCLTTRSTPHYRIEKKTTVSKSSTFGANVGQVSSCGTKLTVELFLLEWNSYVENLLQETELKEKFVGDLEIPENIVASHDTKHYSTQEVTCASGNDDIFDFAHMKNPHQKKPGAFTYAFKATGFSEFNDRFQMVEDIVPKAVDFKNWYGTITKWHKEYTTPGFLKWKEGYMLKESKDRIKLETSQKKAGIKQKPPTQNDKEFSELVDMHETYDVKKRYEAKVAQMNTKAKAVIKKFIVDKKNALAQRNDMFRKLLSNGFIKHISLSSTPKSGGVCPLISFFVEGAGNAEHPSKESIFDDLVASITISDKKAWDDEKIQEKGAAWSKVVKGCGGDYKTKSQLELDAKLEAKAYNAQKAQELKEDFEDGQPVDGDEGDEENEGPASVKKKKNSLSASKKRKHVGSDEEDDQDMLDDASVLSKTPPRLRQRGVLYPGSGRNT